MYLLKGFYSSYLVLNFSSVLPTRNCDIAKNVILQRSWSWKIEVIGQNKWHHRIPWPQEHRCRHQNHHPKSSSSKVMTNDIFLHNSGQRNTFTYVTCSNYSKYFLMYWKAPTQAILCYNLATFCPLITEIGSRMWVYKGHDLERSRS